MRILTILNLQYHYQGTIKKQKLREGCGGRRRAKRAAGTALNEAKRSEGIAEAKAKPVAARPER
jgi:hypothetical protein